jgi:hypothetical protein
VVAGRCRLFLHLLTDPDNHIDGDGNEQHVKGHIFEVAPEPGAEATCLLSVAGSLINAVFILARGFQRIIWIKPGKGRLQQTALLQRYSELPQEAFSTAKFLKEEILREAHLFRIFAELVLHVFFCVRLNLQSLQVGEQLFGAVRLVEKEVEQVSELIYFRPLLL